ncbi:MAG: hypothetical protein WCR60_02375 [Patescibacteria group bacterium]
MPNSNKEFLKKLKSEAKLISSLKKEKFIPDRLSNIANFVATHTWQILLFLALMSSFVWELFFYQGSNG